MSISDRVSSLDDYFLSSFDKHASQFGFNLRSKRFWGKQLADNVIGCVGFTSHKGAPPLWVNVRIGVRFEAVEKLYNELVVPLIAPHVVPDLLSKLSPTASSNLLKIAPEYIKDQENRGILRLTPENVRGQVERTCATFSTAGLAFIDENATLQKAAALMRLGRDGASAVARNLPIMLFMLGRDQEALDVMEMATAWKAPLGRYAEFCEIVRNHFRKHSFDLSP